VRAARVGGIHHGGVEADALARAPGTDEVVVEKLEIAGLQPALLDRFAPRHALR